MAILPNPHAKASSDAIRAARLVDSVVGIGWATDPSGSLVYPSHSATHTETSCGAGVEDNGRPIRLLPVPFRLIDGDIQFKKRQWITAQVEKARKDCAKESHRIGVDTIDCEAPPISTHNSWAD